MKLRGLLTACVIGWSLALSACTGHGASPPRALPKLVPCAVSPLPKPGIPPHTPYPPSLRGPAVTALTGGAIESTLELNNGGLRIDPPRPTDRPTINLNQAECEALATYWSPGEHPQFVMGYGRITVREGLGPSPFNTPQVSQMEGFGPRRYVYVYAPDPAPSTYQNRLAWVLIGPILPARVSCVANPPPPRPYVGYGYEAVVLDADSGGDGLIYREAFPYCGGVQGPYVDAALQNVSVPWTLRGRNADGTAQAAAEVLACDDYFPVALPDIFRHELVRMMTRRPFGPPCGSPHKVPITIESMTRNHLPNNLVHARVGSYVALQ